MTLLVVILAAAPSFTFQGRPIHPDCVTTMLIGEPKATSSVQLKTCGKEPEKLEFKRGRISWTQGKDVGFRPEFSSYRTLGQRGGDWLIEWDWGGGGTGVFTGVSLFHLEKGTLTVLKTFATGDRCNGGLDTSSLDGGVLRYSIAATPREVLRSVQAGQALPIVDGDFESSAMSCFASLDFAEGVFTGLELLDPGADRAGWTEKLRLQGCFNALQRDFMAKGQARLDVAGVEAFVKAFQARCLADAGE